MQIIVTTLKLQTNKYPPIQTTLSRASSLSGPLRTTAEITNANFSTSNLAKKKKNQKSKSNEQTKLTMAPN